MQINSLMRKIALNKRAIKTLHIISPHLVFNEVMNGLVKGVFPLIEITFTALVINELTGARDVSHLLRLVFIGSFILLILGILQAIFEKTISVKKKTFDERHEIFLNSCLYNMPFQNMESREVEEQREKIRGIMEMESGGLQIVATYIGDLTKDIVSAIVASVMCFEMLFYTKNINDKYKLLSSNWMVIVFLIAMGLFLVGISYFSRRMKKDTLKAAMEGTKYNRYLAYYLWEYLDDDMYAKDIRIFNQSEVITREMEEKGFRAWINIFKTCEKVEKRYGGINAFLSAMLSGVIYIFVLMRALAGIIPIGDVVKAYTAIRELVRGLEGITVTITALAYNNEYLELVFSYMDLSKGCDVSEEASGIPIAEIKEIEFRNVSFKYPGSEQYALENVSFTMRKGERLAVVGMNGSGKTTMIKILCGLYQPDSGSVIINGHNILEYDPKEYKKRLAVVFQDFKLFGFSIGENIAVNRQYDTAKVWETIEKVGLRYKIEHMKEQLETSIHKHFNNHGVDISGGEEQKLAIARALYRDADIFILDEPTAALDPESEYEIYSKMDKLTKNKGVIFISHRLSSCYYSDKIIVFYNGRIIQQGKHFELLSDVYGKYYELWNAQASHYIKATSL